MYINITIWNEYRVHLACRNRFVLCNIKLNRNQQVKIFFGLKIVNRRLNEFCEARFQCNGSKHAGVCGENKTCTCDKGFIQIQEKCVLGKH